MNSGSPPRPRTCRSLRDLNVVVAPFDVGNHWTLRSQLRTQMTSPRWYKSARCVPSHRGQKARHPPRCGRSENAETPRRRDAQGVFSDEAASVVLPERHGVRRALRVGRRGEHGECNRSHIQYPDSPGLSAASIQLRFGVWGAFSPPLRPSIRLILSQAIVGPRPANDLPVSRGGRTSILAIQGGEARSPSASPAG